MARITDLRFDVGGTNYAISIDFDDAALVEDTIAFDVVARKQVGKELAQSVHARVEIRPAEDTIVVSVAGQEVFKVDTFGHGEAPVEKLIEAIPAGLLGDPITACAIKGGVSAIIGQAIECCRSLEADKRWRLVQEFLRCMAQNFGHISKTAMYRAFKCILRGGF